MLIRQLFLAKNLLSRRKYADPKRPQTDKLKKVSAGHSLRLI